MPEALLEPLVDPMLSNVVPFEVRVINLDKSTQRWHNMTRQMDALGMTYQRFSAINGYQIPIANKRNDFNHENFTGIELKTGRRSFRLRHHYVIDCMPLQRDLKSVASFVYFPPGGRIATAGELGCSCSHRSLWHQALTSNANFTVILEDDIALSPTFLVNTRLAITQLPPSADMLYLHILPIDRLWYPDQVQHTFSDSVDDIGKIKLFKGNLWGLQAYIVTRKGAEKLLKLTQFMTVHAIDDAIIKVKDQLEVYVTMRDEVGSTMESQFSEIHQMGRFN